MRSWWAKIIAILCLLLILLAASIFGLVQNVSAAANLHSLPSPTGTVHFNHPAHGGATCAQCHHQRQTNGQYTCRKCHEGDARRDVLHKLCTDCHLTAKRQAKPAGPVKLCSQCHRQKKSLSRGREALNIAR